jgi:transcriptional regulator with XRE-family HTH domain
MGDKGPVDIQGLVARNLREIRARRGWSQENLATMMRAGGVALSRAAVAQIETSTRAISLGEFFALVLVLRMHGIGPDEIVGGVDFVWLSPQWPVPTRVLPDLLDAEARFPEMKYAPKVEAEEAEWGSDAVVRAATVLGVDPVDVSDTAVQLWGRGLIEERDRRLNEDPRARGEQSTRVLRGHITRQLLNEIWIELEKES